MHEGCLEPMAERMRAQPDVSATPVQVRSDLTGWGIWTKVATCGCLSQANTPETGEAVLLKWGPLGSRVRETHARGFSPPSQVSTGSFRDARVVRGAGEAQTSAEPWAAPKY